MPSGGMKASPSEQIVRKETLWFRRFFQSTLRNGGAAGFRRREAGTPFSREGRCSPRDKRCGSPPHSNLQIPRFQCLSGLGPGRAERRTLLPAWGHAPPHRAGIDLDCRRVPGLLRFPASGIPRRTPCPVPVLRPCQRENGRQQVFRNLRKPPGPRRQCSIENLAAGNNALSPVPDALGGMRF